MRRLVVARHAGGVDEVRRERRPLRYVAVVVVVTVALLGGLALWASMAPDPAESGGSNSPSCDAVVDWTDDAAGRAAAAAFEDRCAIVEARDARRRTAGLIGVGVVVVAAVASTWPSRRLTAGAGSRAEAAARSSDD